MAHLMRHSTTMSNLLGSL